MPTATTILVGKLFREPEMNYTQDGVAVLSFTLPSDFYKGKDSKETVWIKCSIWEERAEKLVPLMHKGTIVKVQGTLKARIYYGKGDSTAKLAYDLSVKDVELIDHFGKNLQSDDLPAPSLQGIDFDKEPF